MPIACAGLDIKALIDGAERMMEVCGINTPLEENPAAQYAAARNYLYGEQGKKIEMLVNYHPKLHNVSEWWKQLYGESEGKENKGIFPASVDFTTDLHSMGQYIQEGQRILFETVLNVESPRKNVTLQEEASDLDGLNYLAGKTMDFVNKQAYQGTILAHVDGGVPNLRLDIPSVSAYNFEVQKDQNTPKRNGKLGGYEASDFMWTKVENVAPTEGKIKVQLDHMMAGIHVILAEGTGFEEGEFALIAKSVLATGVTRKATINMATGIVNPVGEAQATGIVMCPQTDGSFRAVVAPQTVAAQTSLFSITIEGLTYKFIEKQNNYIISFLLNMIVPFAIIFFVFISIYRYKCLFIRGEIPSDFFAFFHKKA